MVAKMSVDEFLRDVIPVNNKELKKILLKKCTILSYRKGDTINAIGEIDYYVKFLIRGTVRGYILDSGGKEITTIFLTSQGNVISGSRMLNGAQSEIGFKVIRDSEVFCIPVETILDTRTRFQEIIDIQMSMLAASSLYHWETKKMLYLKTAKERYEWFLKEYPGLIDYVNHSDIATFLNITPVTLSRVRHS